MTTHGLFMISLFGLLFLVSCTALKKAGFSNYPACIAISVCVAALCVTGLFNGMNESNAPKSSQPNVSERSMENNTAKTGQSLWKVILQQFPAFVLLSIPGLMFLWLLVQILFHKSPCILLRSKRQQQSTGPQIQGQSKTMIMKDGKSYYVDSQ